MEAAKVHPGSDERANGNNDAEHRTTQPVPRVQHVDWVDSGATEGKRDGGFAPTSANVGRREIATHVITKRLLLAFLAAVFLVSVISIVLSLMALVGRTCSKESEESEAKGTTPVSEALLARIKALEENMKGLAVNMSTLKGSMGPRGPLGPEGSQGPQGPPGLKGVTGNPGFNGSAGLMGPRGLKGCQGDTGIPGFNGSLGQRGLSGFNGSKGEPGQQGAQGMQGLKGGKGDTGLKGDPGINGTDGATGQKGDMGPQGVKGDNGTQGLQGEQGPQGAGNFSQCTYKQMEGSGATPGVTAVSDVTITEPADKRILGVSCSTNGAVEYILRVRQNPTRFICQCGGQSAFFNPTPDSMKCIIHYWECLLTT